jgi:uncharacterized protein YndB with AHSA1/START domain
MSTVTLKDQIHVRASPADVWCFIEDPEMIVLWNPKLQEARVIEPGLVGGCVYRARFVMNGKEHDMRAEVVESVEMHRLVTVYTGGRLPSDGRVRETWELKPDDAGGTLVRHQVDLIDTDMGLIARLLLRLASWCGRPVGEGCMQRLKAVVEQSAHAAEAAR